MKQYPDWLPRVTLAALVDGADVQYLFRED